MSRAGLIPIPEMKNTDNITKNELPATAARFKVIPYKSTRESDESFFVRKRCKAAGILCVFQGQYRINWRRGFRLRFCVGKRQFFAGILCVCQEKLTNFQRKRSAVARRHICAVLPKVLQTNFRRKRSRGPQQSPTKWVWWGKEEQRRD